MNEEIKEKAVILPPFRHMIMTIGELPSSYIETMTYYEMLVWFTNYLGKTIIPAINENGEAVIELQHLFVELQEYVNNYFDNLDVQEEINNKLDDMVEQGTLQEIIASYLNSKAIFGFDSVADMKEATNLINGSYARTLGYYSKNDGGGATYKIRTITNADVVNEMDIISLDDDTLIAELIIENNTINMKQVGCSSNLEDNSTIINTMILKYCNNGDSDKNKNILFPSDTYLITDTINIIRGNFIIDGDNSIIKQMNSQPIIEFTYPSSPLYTNKFSLKNINLRFNTQQTETDTNSYGLKFDHMVYNSNFENISIYNAYIGIGCVNNIDEALWKINWKQILINNFVYRGFDLQSNSGAPQNYFENIYFQCGGVTITSGCCLYGENLQAVIDNFEVNTNTNGCNLVDLTSSSVKFTNFVLEVMTLTSRHMIRALSSTLEFNNMMITKYKGTFAENTAVFLNYRSCILVDNLKITKDTSVLSGNLVIVHNTDTSINKTIINNICNIQNSRVTDYVLTAGNGMSLVEVKKELPTNVASLSTNTKIYGDIFIGRLDDDIELTFDNTTITGGFEYSIIINDFNSHTASLKVPYYNGAFVTWTFTLSGTELTDYKVKFTGRPYRMGCILYKNGVITDSVYLS